MSTATPSDAAGPSTLRTASILGAVALVAGLWTVYDPNVGAGVTVGGFLAWGVCRAFQR